MKKVLVLEDESSIRSFIVINLRRAGYEVIEAGSGEEALEMLQQHSDIRVALLDVMLPGIDGFEVCRRIRATNSRIGIIMLTARSQEMDKVTGLMTGADDYVTKPFSPAELTARVDALMRRSGGSMEEHSGEISQPPFLLNTRNRTLEKNGKPVKLTQVEYSIMRMFMENFSDNVVLVHYKDGIFRYEILGDGLFRELGYTKEEYEKPWKTGQELQSVRENWRMPSSQEGTTRIPLRSKCRIT